jgi:hypothetical protein
MESGMWRWADPNGQQRSVRLDELRASLAAGIIAPNAPVWKPGGKAWQPANEVPELTSASVGGANGVVLSIPPPPLAMVAVQKEYESKAPSIAPLPPTPAAPEVEPPPPPRYMPAPSRPPSLSPTGGLKTQIGGSVHVPGPPPVPVPFPPPPRPSPRSAPSSTRSAPKLGASLPTAIGLAPPPGIMLGKPPAPPLGEATEPDLSLEAALQPDVTSNDERISLGLDADAAGLPRRNVLKMLREDIERLRRKEKPEHVGLVAGVGAGAVLLFIFLIAGIVSLASSPSSTSAKTTPSASASEKAAAVPTSTTTAIATEAPPPPPPPAAAWECSASGEPKMIAPRAVVAAGIEAHALGGGLALGFAPTARDAVATSLDPATLSPTATVHAKPSGGDARRVTPILVGGKLAAIADVERKGDKLVGRRVVASSALVDIGVADGAIVSTPHGRDTYAKLFSLDSGPDVEALRAVPLGERGKGIALAFRRGNTIYFGAAKGDGSLEADGELSKVAGLGGQVGSPALTVSGDTIVVAWADRADASEDWKIRFVRGKVGGTAEGAQTQTLSVPEGGLGGQAMSPSLAPLSGGRVLLAWVEGPVASHQIRAGVLDSDGTLSGSPIAVSPTGVNAGQPAVVVGSGRGAVAYIAVKGRALEVHATPISCSSK